MSSALNSGYFIGPGGKCYMELVLKVVPKYL
jgi:hypothetical protein